LWWRLAEAANSAVFWHNSSIVGFCSGAGADVGESYQVSGVSGLSGGKKRGGSVHGVLRDTVVHAAIGID